MVHKEESVGTELKTLREQTVGGQWLPNSTRTNKGDVTDGSLQANFPDREVKQVRRRQVQGAFAIGKNCELTSR